jgi:coenzyme Q-binding protein COQ10
MFALVADIARYPEFLPWCAKAKILNRQEDGGTIVLVAELGVSFASLREHYTSRVTIDANASTIAAKHINGPFDHLDTLWRFTPKGEGACVVECTVDFSFRNKPLQAVMGLVFGTAVSRMAGAFETRARALYGRSRARLPR